MDWSTVCRHSIKPNHDDAPPHEKWIEFVEDRPFNDRRYYMSNYKLKALGWTIRVGFEDGIRRIVQMHK